MRPHETNSDEDFLHAVKRLHIQAGLSLFAASPQNSPCYFEERPSYDSVVSNTEHGLLSFQGLGCSVDYSDGPHAICSPETIGDVQNVSPSVERTFDFEPVAFSPSSSRASTPPPLDLQAHRPRRPGRGLSYGSRTRSFLTIEEDVRESGTAVTELQPLWDEGFGATTMPIDDPCSFPYYMVTPRDLERTSSETSIIELFSSSSPASLPRVRPTGRLAPAPNWSYDEERPTSCSSAENSPYNRPLFLSCSMDGAPLSSTESHLPSPSATEMLYSDIDSLLQTLNPF